VALFVALAIGLLGGGAWLVDRVLLGARGTDMPTAAPAAALAAVAAPADATAAMPALDAGAAPTAAEAGARAWDAGRAKGEDAGAPKAPPAAVLASLRPVPNGGRLHVVTRPACSLFIDGVEVARAVEDLIVELAPGSHLVEARAAGFQRPARRRVVIKPGHMHRMDLQPKR
jgi:hypothetical protein